ncbi:MAG: carboxypeptidase regulatory-like domain-containing protein [bacterium]
MRSSYLVSLITLGLFCFFDNGIAGEIKGRISSEWLESRKDILVFIENVDSSRAAFTPPKEHPKMDQQDLTFIPHILPIVVGTTVDFPNNDKVQHNVFSPSKTKKFNLGSYPPEEFKSITFDTAGKVVLLCNVHPEMSAYIIVLKNPFFALSDENGGYLISNVPPGTYRVSTWHKNLKTATKEIKVPAQGAVKVNFALTIGNPVNLLKLLK